MRGRIPFLLPLMPPLARVLPRWRAVWRRRRFSNYGPEETLLAGRLRRRCGGREVIVVGNGTQACELALEALAIRGRPVYLPSFTFMATLLAVLRAGGRPRFVDADPLTWNLDPAALPDRLEREAVIFAVHVFGVPCAHRELAARARPLVYDACEAIGSSYDGQDVAGLGDISCFSLHATKLAPAGEGGFMVTADRVLAERMRRLRNFGQLGDQRPTLAGTNAKLSELHAAVGNVSVAALDRVLRRRRRLLAHYRRSLATIPGVTLQAHPVGTLPNGQIMGIRIEKEFGMSRDRLLVEMGRRGFECRAYFNPPCHRYPLCGNTRRRGALPVTEELADRMLCLPFPHTMSERAIERVSETLKLLGRR